MQSENEYIGDDNFKKFLSHYNCPTPISVVKMKFAGAICSPNNNLRPTDVISSFWEEGQEPRLETKNEAELFFKFFMGLWDEMFAEVGFNQISLEKYDITDTKVWALNRYNEIENGFLEGFWGGKEDLKVPSFVADITDKLSELADIYQILAKRKSQDEVTIKTLKETDKMTLKTISFLIENYGIPKIKQIKENTKRTLNS